MARLSRARDGGAHPAGRASVLALAALFLCVPPAVASELAPEPPGAGPASVREPLAKPAAPSGGAEEAGDPKRTRLSNERTLSRWAFVLRRAPARARPRADARRVTRLRLFTEHRTRELVLALTELRTAARGTWVKVRLPMRPNGSTGWVRREALGRYRRVNMLLRINRKRFVAQLYRRGKRIWRAPVGVGVRDAPTPPGRFYVRERLVPRERNGVYGVFAIGLSAYSPGRTDWPLGGVVGIHGTNQPHLIPGRISNGCVRVRNAKIRRLRKLMPLGTPIRIK